MSEATSQKREEGIDERAPRDVDQRHRVLIVGGGTAGISVAARLHHALGSSDVAVIEPSDHHFYQPLWTLVGAGVVDKEITCRREADVIPTGVQWIQDRVAELQPEHDRVVTASGVVIGYDYLVVAPGIQLDWDKIPGLRESLGKNGVCSIYDYGEAERTYDTLRRFKGGTAIFTNPGTPIKCGGAPQKIMYLADELFRRNGVREDSTIIAAFAGKAIFGVDEFRVALEKVIERKGIDFRAQHRLIALRPEVHEAVFEVEGEREVTLSYDVIHVVPPQSAPDFVKKSPLADPDSGGLGWAKVDPHSLQSSDFPNVFAIGDASSLPTSRTGAAVRKQAPVLAENLVAVMEGRDPKARYDGYASCPLLTGYGKVMLAEFDYSGRPTPTFPLDPTKERRSYYLLKRYGLPVLYWNGMLKGRA